MSAVNPGCLISIGSMPHVDDAGEETGNLLYLFRVDQPGAIWHRGTFGIVCAPGETITPAVLHAEFCAFQTRFTAAHDAAWEKSFVTPIGREMKERGIAYMVMILREDGKLAYVLDKEIPENALNQERP